ncbi:unnamed protein product [Arabis nemorensis]|uniref:Exosome complex component N-terminal domain-containing protein n=1 Tax=Arabis nemorensis TaxID=586526 RepID=A0A565CAC9_9BRAS|nr:unnamed protein product [Arabis nemorensis]
MKESPELLVTPGDILGDATELKAGKGAYVNDTTILASLTGLFLLFPNPLTREPLLKLLVTRHMALFRSLVRQWFR